MRITFIGGGNMANALIGGLIRQGQAGADITVVEPNAPARQALADQFGVHVLPDIAPAAWHADVIVLAVKPQQIKDAIAPLAGQLDHQVVVSIAAGTRLRTLADALGGYRRLVRAMPNTPALIGAGITGLFADPSLSANERAQAQAILAAAGATLWVADEDQIDAVTAISGSGPAYVFFFIESLEAGARALGFSDEDARQLALETFRGAALLAAGSSDSPSVLRERVTSKGGTTEAALRALNADGVGEAIVRATEAAFQRGRELGQAGQAAGQGG